MKSKNVLLIVTALVILLGLSAWSISWGSEMTPLTAVQSPGILDEQAVSGALLLTATPEPTEEGEEGGGETEDAASILGDISGTVVNGSGGEVPEGLVVTLHGNHYEEVLNLTTTIEPDGSFIFENIDLVPNLYFYTSVDYMGITYQSRNFYVESDDTQVDLPVVIYETTNDTSNLVISLMQVLFEFVEPNFVFVSYEVSISNLGNETIVSSIDTGPVIRFALPEGASNLTFEEGYGIGLTYVITDDGFGDPIPIIPGDDVYQIVYAYELPYISGLDWVQQIHLPVEAAILYFQGESLTIESSMFQPYETGEGMPLQIYIGGMLSDGDEMRAEIIGDNPFVPTSPAVSSTKNRLTTTTTIILGVVGLAMIGAGVWWWMRPSTSAGDAYLDDGSPEAIMDAIIALDADHEAGRIDEAEYLEERAALKDRLREVLEK